MCFSDPINNGRSTRSAIWFEKQLYIGAFQAGVNNGDVQNLSEEDAIERDCLIYRSYITLGSYQLVINEIIRVDQIHELLDLIRNQLHCSG
ncbi:hypothetical protein QVD17_09025 [Tagetes erecta]|uniref:Uncharacterized protein n=1 Tax=Tagetes erecta TaxID=13708 RepID=A0AAD8L053_TARER|nr:hypothetical protein QVD17_09025 [Tagetes erecta]